MIVNRIILTTLILIFALTGCVNLKGVRDFASESAKFTAYTDLTTRFRDTYQRERPYLSGKVNQEAQINDKRRKEAYDDLLKIHQGVSTYMQTLAKLAGDDTFDVSKGMDSLASGIKSYPELGIDEKKVDAFSNISKVVARWITSGYQERAVREMVKDGDPHLQKLLDGMLLLVRYYKKTDENEGKTVLGFFEIEIPYADTPKDKLLVTLAKAHVQSKTFEYQATSSKYGEAEKGIKTISEGHKQLLKNIDKLSSDEAKALISKFSNDIKTIRENLQTIHF